MTTYPEYEIRYDPYTGRQYWVPKGAQGIPQTVGATTPGAQTSAGRSGIIRVKGRPGAETFAMGPNEDALLLDETAPIVWLKRTDGAGYPSLDAYDLSPHEETKAEPDGEDHYNALEKRIEKLEKLAEVITNGGESDSSKAGSVGSTKSRRNGTGAADGVRAGGGDEG